MCGCSPLMRRYCCIIGVCASSGAFTGAIIGARRWRIPLEALEIEFEQLEGVGAPDLDAVGFADAGRIEPLGGVVDVLEAPVGRKQDPLGAALQHRVDQALPPDITPT